MSHSTSNPQVLPPFFRFRPLRSLSSFIQASSGSENPNHFRSTQRILSTIFLLPSTRLQNHVSQFLVYLFQTFYYLFSKLNFLYFFLLQLFKTKISYVSYKNKTFCFLIKKKNSKIIFIISKNLTHFLNYYVIYLTYFYLYPILDKILCNSELCYIYIASHCCLNFILLLFPLPFQVGIQLDLTYFVTILS